MLSTSTLDAFDVTFLQAFSMLIEVGTEIYGDLTPDEFKACYVIPPMNQQRTSIVRYTRTNNATVNRWLRDALKAATGRDWVVQGGPATSTAAGKRPPNAIDITFKGFRRAIQQYGLGRGLSDLDMRACCDWLGDSGVLYFEVDEDARGKLLRILNGVAGPLPDVVAPYNGDAPLNLAYTSVFAVDSWEAMREFCLQCIKSAFPWYERNESAIENMRQLLKGFETIPAPIRGTFSEYPWGVALPQGQPPPPRPAPKNAIQLGLQFNEHVKRLSTSDAVKQVGLAAASALAVALANCPIDSQLSAVSAMARSAASLMRCPAAPLQSAAQAAVLVAQHHPNIFCPYRRV